MMLFLWGIYDQSFGLGGFIQEAERVYGQKIDRARLEDIWHAFNVAVEEHKSIVSTNS